MLIVFYGTCFDISHVSFFGDAYIKKRPMHHYTGRKSSLDRKSEATGHQTQKRGLVWRQAEVINLDQRGT